MTKSSNQFLLDRHQTPWSKFQALTCLMRTHQLLLNTRQSHLSQGHQFHDKKVFIVLVPERKLPRDLRSRESLSFHLLNKKLQIFVRLYNVLRLSYISVVGCLEIGEQAIYLKTLLRLIQTCVIRCVKRSRVGRN